ncbi:MAG: hypothetical protein N2246_10645, partial [Candidatus Sumerlaeia bacterium]|nr:hypothetical protein [Candidatus Sumerlaeia bacterium]
MINPDTKLIGQLLVAEGRLDPDDLDRALREHHKSGERLGTVLIKMGLAGTYTVRDLWRQEELGEVEHSVVVSVPSHGARLLKLV